MLTDLHQQGDQPDQAESDVQPMDAHQREERGQEGAALGRGPHPDHVAEGVDLDPQEGQTEQAGQGQPAERGVLLAVLHGHDAMTAGEGRTQQQGGAQRHKLQVEDVRPGEAGCVAPPQDGVGGKEAGEEEQITDQEEPEAKHRPVLGGMRFRQVELAGTGFGRSLAGQGCAHVRGGECGSWTGTDAQT